MSKADLDQIQARAEAAAAAVGEEWAWDDGTLIDLCRHESPIGIECTWASGSPAAPHIAGMDPMTTLALVAELRVLREVVQAVKGAGHGGPDSLHWDPECGQCRTIAAYDKVTGEHQ